MPTEEQRQRQERMGRRIVAAREHRQMTQEQLADAVRVDQSAISLYESGRNVPRPERRRAIERALGLPEGELQRALEPEAQQAATQSRMERQLDELLITQARVIELLEGLLEEREARRPDERGV